MWLSPELFKDNVNLATFLLGTSLLIVMGLVGLAVWALGRIKDFDRRARITAIGGAVLMNGLMLSMLGKRPGRLIGDIICFSVLNLMFLGIYLFPKYAKKRGIPMRFDEDMNLKSQPIERKGILECPACGRRTISQVHVFAAPQTCGECGKKFRVLKSWQKELFIAVWLLGLPGISIYLAAKGVIGNWVALATFVIAIAVIIPIQQRVKLQEEKTG